MENDQYVVSVGAGKNQVLLIKKLVDRGYKVIAFDKDRNAPGKYWSYRFNCISTWDYEEAIIWLDSLNLVFRGILCFSCGKALLNQQKILHHYKLLGQIDPRFFILMEDKAQQRRLLYTLGLSTLKEYNSLKDVPQEFTQKKVIIKDIKGIASNCVFLLGPEFCLRGNNSLPTNYIVQEYIEGTEYRIVCLVKNKNIKFIAVMERDNFDNTFFTGRLKPEVIRDESIWNFVKKVVKKLLINDSVLKIDLIKQGDRIEIIELDFGIGGDYFETFISPLCYGYNFIDNYINLMLGLPVQDEYEVDDNLCFDYVYNLNREKAVIVNYDIIRNTCQGKFSQFELVKIKAEGDRVYYPKSNMDALFALIHNRKDMSNYEINLLFNKALFNEVPL